MVLPGGMVTLRKRRPLVWLALLALSVVPVRATVPEVSWASSLLAVMEVVNSVIVCCLPEEQLPPS